MNELTIDELDKVSGGDPNLGGYVYRDGPGGLGLYVPPPPPPPPTHNPGVSAGSRNGIMGLL
jgi:bacteriocin-like protein